MPALGNCALKNAIISISSKVENVADELKTKFWAGWNNNVKWAAQKDLSRTSSSRLVSYLLFKVTQKVLSFLSISIFNSVKNHFVLLDQ